MEYFSGERFALLDPGEFQGWAVTWGTKIDTWIPTRFWKGAFEETLKDRTRPVKLTWMHDLADLVGLPLELSERPKGLWLHGKLTMTRKIQFDYLPLLLSGVVDSLSIGWNALTWDIEDDKTVEGGQLRNIRKAELIEIAFVGLGADPKARIEDVAARRARSGHICGSADALAAILHMEALVRQYGQHDRPTTPAAMAAAPLFAPRDTGLTDAQRAGRALYAMQQDLADDRLRMAQHNRRMAEASWAHTRRALVY
ncbi:MAG: HK97 family phage prohead protease [Candidatus Entotheonellia bacterium]